MYQVTATYKVVTVTHLKLNGLQKFFGMADTETEQKGGTVQFTCDSLNDGMSKLSYLIPQLETVDEISFRLIR